MLLQYENLVLHYLWFLIVRSIFCAVLNTLLIISFCMWHQFPPPYQGLWKIPIWYWGWPKCCCCFPVCKSSNASIWISDPTMWRRRINHTYCWPPESWGQICIVLLTFLVNLFRGVAATHCIYFSGLECPWDTASTLWIIKSCGTENDYCGEFNPWLSLFLDSR